MSLEARLIKEKMRLDLIALRSPTTDRELLDRQRWERVRKILIQRYDRQD